MPQVPLAMSENVGFNTTGSVSSDGTDGGGGGDLHSTVHDFLGFSFRGTTWTMLAGTELGKSSHYIK